MSDKCPICKKEWEIPKTNQMYQAIIKIKTLTDSFDDGVLREINLIAAESLFKLVKPQLKNLK